MFTDVVHLPIVKTLVWPNEAATQQFAAALATCPALPDALITLHGDLGAGKTTLVRHLLRALGVPGRIKSPTYAVVEPHELPGQNIWHFDFYRFCDPREWEDAGFRDIFASPGLKLVEWPDKATGCLPQADLAIELRVQDEDARWITLTAQTGTGLDLLEFGLAAPVRRLMAGHGKP
ncbi:MAG: tRNA (adenosine(37)-N6)-threonylcarbamoyltransferase complex ATPase subunit type 1 TsaE [Rhodoferax sp.]